MNFDTFYNSVKNDVFESCTGADPHIEDGFGLLEELLGFETLEKLTVGIASYRLAEDQVVDEGKEGALELMKEGEEGEEEGKQGHWVLLDLFGISNNIIA